MKIKKNFVNLLFLGVIASLVASCTPLQFTSGLTAYQPPAPYLGRVKIALVLGGGGAKGMAHVGALEVLENAGIKPDLIVGTSAGAIVGGLYADNPNAAELKNLLMSKRRDHLVDFSPGTLPFGLSNGIAMKNFLQQHLRAKTFSGLRIPFIAVTTNLQFGTTLAIGSGPLEPAIRASAAFPGVFAPVLIGQQYFVDGGVTNNIPVDIARDMGAEYIIAIELSTNLPKAAPTNALGVLKRCLEIGLIHQSRIATKGADFTIKIPLDGVSTFQDGVNEFTYAQGKATVKQVIEKLKQRLNERF